MFERMKNPFGQSNFNSNFIFVYFIKIRVLKLKKITGSLRISVI
jgi:hypothetical protein